MRYARPAIKPAVYDALIKDLLESFPSVSVEFLIHKVLRLREDRGFRHSGSQARAQAVGIVIGSLQRLGVKVG